MRIRIVRKITYCGGMYLKGDTTLVRRSLLIEMVQWEKQTQLKEMMVQKLRSGNRNELGLSFPEDKKTAWRD